MDSINKVTEPIENLMQLDNYIDELIHQVSMKINQDVDSIDNKISDINIRDIIRNYSDEKKDSSKSFQEELEKQISGLEDKNILEEIRNAAVPKERLNRYKRYNEVINETYIASRMLQVYMDNILIKNPHNKMFLDILESDALNKDNSLSLEDKKVFVKTAAAIFTFFNIPNKIKNDILPKQLVLGNFFIEVSSINEYKDILNRRESLAILNENAGKPETKFKIKNITFDFNNLIEEENQGAAAPELSFDEQLKILLKNVQKDKDTQILYENYIEKNSAQTMIEDIRKADFSLLRYISLRYVSPENVIILEKDGTNYGYLVIEEHGKKQKTEEINIFKTVSGYMSSDQSKGSEDENEYLDKIFHQMFKKIKNNFSNVAEMLQAIEDPAVKMAIYSIIKDKLKKYSNVTVRYVPAKRLINYSNPVNKYAPYGTSIFDDILFPAKLYSISLVSSIISRLNRASVIRKWSLDVGNRKNVSEIVEKFKQQLRNRTITMEDILSLKDISNLITDYSDIVTPVVNGKQIVDLQLLPLHDRSMPLSELETLKQELIAASGVPSIALGITDNYDLRETLVQANINFAQKISTIQSLINDSNENLLDAIFEEWMKLNGFETENKLSKFVDIKLNPPLVLALQHLESVVSVVSNVVNQISSMNVPVDPVSFLQKYVKSIDWESVKEKGLEFQKNAQIKQAIQQEIQNAMQQAAANANPDAGDMGAGF